MTNNPITTGVNLSPRNHTPRPAGRVLYSAREVAGLLGKPYGAFIRMVQRHAVDEGDERVVHLAHGIVGRRRKRSHWSFYVPPGLKV
jgi:hypothetical protein